MAITVCTPWCAVNYPPNKCTSATQTLIFTACWLSLRIFLLRQCPIRELATRPNVRPQPRSVKRKAFTAPPKAEVSAIDSAASASLSPPTGA